MSARIFDKLDTSLGTLWWVREDEWAKKIANYSSNRDSHPGLSISEAKAECPSYVLMLHGRSQRSGDSVVIRGMTRIDPKHLTYFRQIGPANARIDASLFTSWTTALGHDDPDWTRHTAVVLNHDKPWISADEEKELIRWLAKRRERQPWWKHENP